mmetsp:Transcript_56291/g.163221  ORF Transcript_56291/g.163221 Transcript_56291/m.163221 type:complete len:213 (-) Transcript_56291:332-970(-)
MSTATPADATAANEGARADRLSTPPTSARAALGNGQESTTLKPTAVVLIHVAVVVVVVGSAEDVLDDPVEDADVDADDEVDVVTVVVESPLLEVDPDSDDELVVPEQRSGSFALHSHWLTLCRAVHLPVPTALDLDALGGRGPHSTSILPQLSMSATSVDMGPPSAHGPSVLNLITDPRPAMAHQELSMFASNKSSRPPEMHTPSEPKAHSP